MRCDPVGDMYCDEPLAPPGVVGVYGMYPALCSSSYLT